MRTGGDDIGEKETLCNYTCSSRVHRRRAKAFRQFVVSRAVNVLCACLFFVCLFAILLKDPDKNENRLNHRQMAAPWCSNAMLVYDSYSRGFVCSSCQGYVAHTQFGLMLTKFFLWITDGAGAVDVYALSRDIKSLVARTAALTPKLIETERQSGSALGPLFTTDKVCNAAMNVKCIMMHLSPDGSVQTKEKNKNQTNQPTSGKIS